jgi:replication-associated recombination protein RarA
MSSKQQSFLEEPVTAPATKGGGASREIKLGYRFGEVTSAMQKEIRRGDEDAALWWALLLYEAAPQYAWKRVLITAAEDIGFGDPAAVAQVSALAQAWRLAKEGSYSVTAHHFTMAVMTLCRALKSTEVEDAQTYTLERLKAAQRDVSLRRAIPDYALDLHTAAGRAKGTLTWADWYQTRHRRFGVPLNTYTMRLAALKPEWFGWLAEASDD